MTRPVNDPAVLMLAALARDAAREQLMELHRAVKNAQHLVKAWALLEEKADLQDSTALVAWLSHEVPEQGHLLEDAASTLEDFLFSIADAVEAYQGFKRRQREMNRIRLRLMGDVDFPGGQYYEDLIKECAATADKAALRRR